MPKSIMSMQSTQFSEKKINRSQGTTLMGTKDDSKSPLDLRDILKLPVPKKASTGFMMYVKERMPLLIVEKNEEIAKVQVYIKTIGEEWKVLSKTDQERYVNLSLKDKERQRNQEEELKTKGYFTLANGQQSNHVLPKSLKFLEHVIQPKKPITPYLHYYMQIRKDLVLKNPGLKMNELSKTIGELWLKVDDSERVKFEKIAAKDKIRYDDQLNDLLTLGYFTMADGSKSSDHQRIVKKKKELRNDQIEEMLYEDGNVIKSAKSLKQKSKVVNEEMVKSSKFKEKISNAERQSPRKSPNDQNSQKVQNSKSKDEIIVDQKQKSRSKKIVKESSSKSLEEKVIDRNESPNSKRKMSPSKDQKALKSSTRKPSPEKSMKDACLSLSSQKDRNPRSKKEESPDAKKVRQTAQTKPNTNVNKVVSLLEKDKANAQKIRKSSKSKRDESPEKTIKQQKSRTPLKN